jgi:hypothetical protein
MFPRRAASWIVLAIVWNLAWTAGFLGLVRATRGAAYVAKHLPDGSWPDYWLIVMTLPFALGPWLVSLAWRKWLYPDAAPAPATLRGSPWLAASWLTPVGAAWASALVAHLAGWGAFDLGGASIVARKQLGAAEAAALQAQLDAAPLPYGVYVCVSALVVSAMMYMPLRLAEEVGWRGVLDRELAPLGAWGSLVVGALAWAIAQLPLAYLGFHFPGEGINGILALLAALVPLGVLLGWLRRTAGSPWASAAFLGTMSGLAGFHEIVLTVGSAPRQSLLGWPGAIVFGLLALAAYLATRAGLVSWDGGGQAPLRNASPLASGTPTGGAIEPEKRSSEQLA